LPYLEKEHVMKNKNSSSVRSLLRSTRGANMVEYIILVGVVALLAVTGFKLFGNSVSTTVTNQGKTVESGNTKNNF
jgi:pilus assembly protein Flp/PilA